MPGAEKQPRLPPLPVVLSGPNRVLSLVALPNRIPMEFSLPARRLYSSTKTVVGLDWPVSPPLSTPPPHSDGAGSWTVSGLGAP
jgi:hypothetical protein